MSTHDKSAPSHQRPPLGAILAVPVIVALVLTLFAWPNARIEPRDLPIGVAGPPAAAAAIEQRLGTAGEGAFDIHRYAGEPAARQAIEDRDVYGAFVATPRGLEVLTASAASPAVAQMITRAASESGARGQSEAVRVRDVVSAPPAGGALASSVLPLVIAGILTGVAGVAIASGGLQRAGLLVAGSILAGLAATAVVQGWLDVLEGDWLANAGALSLTVLAIAAALAGLEALFGKVGLIAGALLMIFIGNPFSAVGSAPELLPQPVGGLGQLLPPGAGANLARSTGYFDGAGAEVHLVVLATWALAGLAAVLAAGVRGWRPRAVAAQA